MFILVRERPQNVDKNNVHFCWFVSFGKVLLNRPDKIQDILKNVKAKF